MLDAYHSKIISEVFLDATKNYRTYYDGEKDGPGRNNRTRPKPLYFAINNIYTGINRN